jgi:hypothetical protein
MNWLANAFARMELVVEPLCIVAEPAPTRVSSSLVERYNHATWWEGTCRPASR